MKTVLWICPQCKQGYDLAPDKEYVCMGGCRVMLVKAKRPQEPPDQNRGTLRVDYRIVEGRFVVIFIENDTPDRSITSKIISKDVTQHFAHWPPSQLKRNIFSAPGLPLDEGADMTVTLKLLEPIK